MTNTEILFKLLAALVPVVEKIFTSLKETNDANEVEKILDSIDPDELTGIVCGVSKKA